MKTSKKALLGMWKLINNKVGKTAAKTKVSGFCDSECYFI